MIIKRLENILGTERHVTGAGWQSRRVLLADDGLGYSLHDTVLDEGCELHLHYKNHVESNYCIAGQGEVEDVATGAVHPLTPGTMYALENHDAHILRALKGQLRLICVFTPALTGHETHDPDGSYAISD
jgi:L-ectoine synthase